MLPLEILTANHHELWFLLNKKPSGFFDQIFSSLSSLVNRDEEDAFVLSITRYLDSYPELLDVQEKNSGKSCFHYAIEQDHFDRIEMLIQKGGNLSLKDLVRLLC